MGWAEAVYPRSKSNPLFPALPGQFPSPRPKFLSPKQRSGNLSSWREISALGFTWMAPEGREGRKLHYLSRSCRMS